MLARMFEEVIPRYKQRRSCDLYPSLTLFSFSFSCCGVSHALKATRAREASNVDNQTDLQRAQNKMAKQGDEAVGVQGRYSTQRVREEKVKSF